MMSLVCAAIIGVANPCQPHAIAPALTTNTVMAAKGPRLHSKRDRLQRVTWPRFSVEPLRERFYPLPADLAVIAHLEPSAPVPSPAPERPHRREPQTVIARETVVKNTITTAYARIDRPVTKGPSPLPNFGETKMRANTAITRPLSPRSDGAVQHVSAPAGLRDLIRGAEERKAREAESKTERKLQGPLCPGRRQRGHGLRQEERPADVGAAEGPRQVRRAVVVDSAYRSPAYNRKVSGAKNSYHMSCNALDIYVDKRQQGRPARLCPHPAGDRRRRHLRLRFHPYGHWARCATGTGAERRARLAQRSERLGTCCVSRKLFVTIAGSLDGLAPTWARWPNRQGNARAVGSGNMAAASALRADVSHSRLHSRDVSPERDPTRSSRQ